MQDVWVQSNVPYGEPWDDDVVLADSDDEGQTLSPKSPDARSEKVEHDAPELMREYGSSNFWGSAIDDSLVPDDI